MAWIALGLIAPLEVVTSGEDKPCFVADSPLSQRLEVNLFGI